MQDQEAALADELARARRRAFSRGATTADLEHLRALEARALEARALEARALEVRALEARAHAEPASRDTADASVEVIADATDGPRVDADAAEPTDSGDEPVAGRGRRRWLRPAALGLLGGILVGFLLATVTSPLLGLVPWRVALYEGVPDAGSAGSSLAIFDRTPSERDVLGAAAFPPVFGPEAGTPEVRWLGDLDGATIYAARGEQDGETTICLVAIQSSRTAGGACSSVTDFEAFGISGAFDGLAVRWGPTGTAAWVPYEPEAR